MGECSLPEPEVLGCAFDDRSHSGHPVLRLDWGVGAALERRRSWHLPQGLSLSGPPPTCFAFSILRHGPDAYDVQILWDQVSVVWTAVSRREIEGSSLRMLMVAVGTDLNYLLNQPILPAPAACPTQTAWARKTG
jgi:hypothetical protein